MEYFDIELIYQHLKDNYPGADDLKKCRHNIKICGEYIRYYHYKFCHFDMCSITILDFNGDFMINEFFPEDFETHEELFEKIYESAIMYPTIYQKYLIAKQRDTKIDDIFND